jgi:methylisocitrate lyase
MFCIYPAVRSMQEALQALREGDLKQVSELGINWSDFNELIGVKKWRRLEEESAVR